MISLDLKYNWFLKCLLLRVYLKRPFCRTAEILLIQSEMQTLLSNCRRNAKQ